MKLNRKLKLAIVIGVVIVLAGGLSVRWAPPPPEQIITLPSGEQYRFAGVTYEKEAVPPTFLAHVVRWLPSRWAEPVRTHLGARISQTNRGEKYDVPHLFIWYQHLGTSTSVTGARTVFIPTAQLADEAGVQSGVQGFPIFENSVTWSFVHFPVVPKRSRTLQCLFYPTGYGPEAFQCFSRITFENPLYRQFRQWTPEPVPTIKRVGDLEVRLDELNSGHPVSGATILKSNGSRAPAYVPIRGGETPNQTGLDISLRSSKGTNVWWIPHSAELSDATGNVLLTESYYDSDVTSARRYARVSSTGWSGFCESIWGTLWPDEAAWKLKLELKRATGFGPAELVTFKSVPIPPSGVTNTSFIARTVGGMEVVLTKFERRPNITQSTFGLGSGATQIRIDLPDKPTGVVLDFLEMTTDTSVSVERYSYYRSDFGYDFWVLSIPTNAHTLDLTFVLQKTRSVEFLVKPPGVK